MSIIMLLLRLLLHSWFERLIRVLDPFVIIAIQYYWTDPSRHDFERLLVIVCIDGCVVWVYS